MDLRYIKGASRLACLVSTDALGSSLASVDLRADLRQSRCVLIVLYWRIVRYVLVYMYSVSIRYYISYCQVLLKTLLDVPASLAVLLIVLLLVVLRRTVLLLPVAWGATSPPFLWPTILFVWTSQITIDCAATSSIRNCLSVWLPLFANNMII